MTRNPDNGAVAGLKLSIVVPTFQEAENVPYLIPRISESCCGIAGGYEIILVDDNSNDGTEKAVTEMAKQGHPVRVIVRTNQRGLSSAVLRGFREARGEILLCMDADLSHPPEKIHEMVQVLDDEPETDFVIGSRYIKGGQTESGWGVARWLNSKIATLLARPFTLVKDPMAGFFGLKQTTLVQAEELDPIGYKIALELIVKCRCRQVREVPISFADRQHGQSKLCLAEQWSYVKHLKRLTEYKYGKIAQFMEFCFVGATGMAVDLCVLAATRAAEVPFSFARMASILSAMTWNFWLNRRLAFSYSREGGLMRQYVRFVASCSVGAAVNWSVSIGLVSAVVFFKHNVYAAAIAGIAAGTLLNFYACCLWVFHKKRAEASDAE